MRGGGVLMCTHSLTQHTYYIRVTLHSRVDKVIGGGKGWVEVYMGSTTSWLVGDGEEKRYTRFVCMYICIRVKRLIRGT